MNVEIDPELEKFVEEQVKAGRFSSAAEVLEAGIARLMLDPLPDELDAEDLAAIEESEQQIARGEARDWKQISPALRKKCLSASDFEPGELDGLLAQGEQSGTPLDGKTVLDELRQLK